MTKIYQALPLLECYTSFRHLLPSFRIVIKAGEPGYETRLRGYFKGCCATIQILNPYSTDNIVQCM